MKTFTGILAILLNTLNGCGPDFGDPPEGIFWDSEGQYQTIQGAPIDARLFFDGTRWLKVRQNQYVLLTSIYLDAYPGMRLGGAHWVWIEAGGFFLVRENDGSYRAFEKSLEEERVGGEAVRKEEIPFPPFQGEIASYNAGQTLVGLKNNTELWRWDHEGIGWFKWQDLRSPADFWMLAGGRVLSVSGRMAEVYPMEEGPLKAGKVPGNGPVILTQDGTHLLYWDQELMLFDLETFQSRPFRAE